MRRDGASLLGAGRRARAARRAGRDRGGPAPVHRLRRPPRRPGRSSRRASEQLAEAQRIARIGGWQWDLATDEINASARAAAPSTRLHRGDVGRRATQAFLDDRPPEDDRASVQDAHRRRPATHGGSCSSPGCAARTATGCGPGPRRRRPPRLTATRRDVGHPPGRHRGPARRPRPRGPGRRQNTLLRRAVASAANEAVTLEEVLAPRPHPGAARTTTGARPGLRAHGGRVRASYPCTSSEEERLEDAATPEESAMELALANRAFQPGPSVGSPRRC